MIIFFAIFKNFLSGLSPSMSNKEVVPINSDKIIFLLFPTNSGFICS